LPNLVTVGQTVWALVGWPQKLGCWAHAALEWGVSDPKKHALPPQVLAPQIWSFAVKRFMSWSFSRRVWPFMSYLSRDGHGSISQLWLPISVLWQLWAYLIPFL